MQAVRLSRSQRRAGARTLVQAFWNYSETVHLLPSESARRRALPRYLSGDCADSQAYDALLGVVVDGQVVGAAAWLPPEAYPVPARRQVAQVRYLLPAVPWALGTAREARRGQLVNRARHPREPHFYLRSVGVLPSWQGRGVGGAMLLPMIEEADKRALGCYLTTAEFQNVAFYERFNFRVLASYYPTPTWPKVWSMWRDPR